ncbi:MAG: DUF4190 domain-containing protein [Polyangiaceae bacterium]
MTRSHPQPPSPPPPPRPPLGPPPPGRPPHGSLPRADEKAVASVVLGALSVAGALFWLGLVLGIPAIALGALAHRDLRRSRGADADHGLATAGIVLGSIGSTLFVGFLAFTVFVMSGGTTLRSFAPIQSLAQSEIANAVEPAAATPPPAPPPPMRPVVELHPAAGALRVQLAGEAARAKRSGDVVLVQTTARGCVPCSEVTAAQADTEVQAALSHVRLVRIDVGEFQKELKGLRMDEATAPWFYLIDVRGQPRDAISADEWDDNDAADIAPVLGAFVRGKLRARRSPWRGETYL